MRILEVGSLWTIVEVDGIEYAVFSLLDPFKLTVTLPRMEEE